jgi:hypothetical protein
MGGNSGWMFEQDHRQRSVQANEVGISAIRPKRAAIVKYMIVLLATISFTIGAQAQSATPQNEERFTQRDPKNDPSGNRLRPQESMGPINTRSSDAPAGSPQGETSLEVQSTPSGSAGSVKTKASDQMRDGRN